MYTMNSFKICFMPKTSAGTLFPGDEWEGLVVLFQTNLYKLECSLEKTKRN